MASRPGKIVLADGTELEHSSAGAAGNFLWCWISGKTMSECFALFGDPDKTSEIRVVFKNTICTYRGYTEIQTVRKDVDAFGEVTIAVQLTWPEGGEHSATETPVTRE